MNWIASAVTVCRGGYNRPGSSMNERLCYWLTASAAVWLMGQSGDYKDAIRVYG